MRDHHDGPQWDNRTLNDLTWYRIRVVCLLCRHCAYVRPADLAKRYPDRKRWSWRLFIPKFRCTSCGKRKVEAIAEKLPRD